jgi:hypothetical protein
MNAGILNIVLTCSVQESISRWRNIFEVTNETCEVQRDGLLVHSTDHELIPARNVILAAVQGSSRRSNVRYYTMEIIRPSKKEMNKSVTMPDVCSLAMNYYVFLSLNNSKSSVHLYALYSPTLY